MRSLAQIEADRQARIDKMTEEFIESAKDPLEALNLRVEVLEAALTAQAEMMLKLMRQLEPESKDHEWASEDETKNVPRCTCIRWTDWETNVPRRKHNRFCRFPHNA